MLDGWAAILDRRSRSRGNYFQAEEASWLEGPGGAGQHGWKGVDLDKWGKWAGARIVTKSLTLSFPAGDMGMVRL